MKSRPTIKRNLSSTLEPMEPRIAPAGLQVLNVSDPALLSHSEIGTVSNVSVAIYEGIYVSSPGVSVAGHYTLPKVIVHDIATNTDLTINAYASTVRDSIRTAVADFNNDGFDDVLVFTEHAKGPVKIFNGRNGSEIISPLTDLRPFGAKQGGFVAAGTFEHGSGSDSPPSFTFTDEVVFGSSLGGGAVKTYSAESPVSLAAVPTAPPQQIGTTFYPFGKSFTGGVRVAVGDFDGDGRNDLVVAQGNFGSQVKVYKDGDTTNMIASFKVGNGKFNGGLNLAVGDIDHDGRAEIITGRNRLSAPTVEVFSYSPDGVGHAHLDAGFNAFAKSYQQGVRVALADTNNDGFLDIIAAPGFGGGSKVNIFDGSFFGLQKGAFITPVVPTSPDLLDSYIAFSASPNQAVWVSGSAARPT